jgi:putative sterol carrier protein
MTLVTENMTEWFPSREWLETYRAALNDNDTYREASEEWGVESEGDFVFEITDVPVTETTVGDLPDDLSEELRNNLESLSGEEIEELLADAPAALDDRMAEYESESADEDTDRERLIGALLTTPVGDAPQVTFPTLRDEFPADLDNLLGQLERYVHNGTIYAYVDLYDGECRETEVLEDPSARNPGFDLVGPYSHWKDLLKGKDVMESIFSEDLTLDGSTTTILPYADAAEELGDTAGRVDSRFLF